MPHSPTSIMIFAAGFGTRMGALTREMPKPLVPLAGRPMIDHAIDMARAAGVSKIVANLHYRSAQLAAHLEPLGVAVSVEHPRVLDTGGGLRNALPLIGSDPLFTLNPDAAWRGPNPLSHLAAAWDPARMDALLLLVPRDRAGGYCGAGDFTAAGDGRLSRGPGQVYTGAQILRTELLAEVADEVFSLNRIWDMMQNRGRLFGLSYPGQWCDIGTARGLARGEDLLKDHHV